MPARAYRSPINQDVEPARPGEFSPLDLGLVLDGETRPIWPPVVLAPMAGVTNPPFRRICRQYGAGLYVSEMISARGLVEGNRRTHDLAHFAPDEIPRSIQLYGTEPDSLGRAAKALVHEGKVDHIDLNFGCPVRKVMKNGGGAAIPLKPRLLSSLVGAVVQAAGDVPVTIKVRLGVDEEHLSYLEAGRIARDQGCRSIGLHARTAAQLYAGQARWEAIAELKAHLGDFPVLGNGDIWEAWDALRMMRQTRCDGVIVGRGCLGRPWLFEDLARVFDGQEPGPLPNLGQVIAVMRRHAAELADCVGEFQAVLHLRKWCQWYLKGFHGTTPVRAELSRVKSREALFEVLDGLDPNTAYPVEVIRTSRAKRSTTQKPTLPQGFLDDDPPPSTSSDGKEPVKPIGPSDLPQVDEKLLSGG